jgi:SnoaL-like domain
MDHNIHPALQRLLDETDIHNLAAKFSDAANRKDGALFESLWAPDGEWIIGPPINMQFKGRDTMAANVLHMLGLWEFFFQLTGAGVIELNGDHATARFYINEIASNHKGEGNYNLSMYADTLVRVEGKWLFQKREYHTVYQDAPSYKGLVQPLS